MSRRALVTGASRGIGRAVAVALAADGHEVVASARTGAGLRETVGSARGASGRVVALEADLADPDQCLALAGRASDALGGPIEIVVYCAGIARPGAIADLPTAAWNESMQVNATGAFQVIQPAIGPMVERGWGRIVNIASLYARFGAKHAGAYAASKHAILGLTRVLAVELVRGGVTANAIVPGFVDTEMVRDEAEEVARGRGIEPEEAIRLFLRVQPLGRLIRPEEVAGLVAYLCGDRTGAITGQAFGIDGGAYQA